MRFLRGVIDSEDIPLNISRELLQNNSLIRFIVNFIWICSFIFLVFSKLRETVTSRVVRFFLEQSRKDPEKYMKFHDGYKMFITEGVLSEETAEKKVFVDFYLASSSLYLLSNRKKSPSFFGMSPRLCQKVRALVWRNIFHEWKKVNATFTIYVLPSNFQFVLFILIWQICITWKYFYKLISNL